VSETRKRFEIEQEFCKYEFQSDKFCKLCNFQLKPKGIISQFSKTFYYWFVSYSFTFSLSHVYHRLQGFIFTLNVKAFVYNTSNDSDNVTSIFLTKVWSRSSFHSAKYMTLSQSKLKQKDNLKKPSKPSLSILTTPSIEPFITFSTINIINIININASYINNNADSNHSNLYDNLHSPLSLKMKLVTLAEVNHPTANYADISSCLDKHHARSSLNEISPDCLYRQYFSYLPLIHLRIQLKDTSDRKSLVLCLFFKSKYYYDYRQVMIRNNKPKPKRNSGSKVNNSNVCLISKRHGTCVYPNITIDRCSLTFPFLSLCTANAIEVDGEMNNLEMLYFDDGLQ
jgi:hypothetical protein